MKSPRTEESIRKRWSYIKQETDKFCAAVEHLVVHPQSGIGVLGVVKKRASSFYSMYIISEP
jgi:hypothetical protein